MLCLGQTSEHLGEIFLLEFRKIEVNLVFDWFIT